MVSPLGAGHYPDSPNLILSWERLARQGFSKALRNRTKKAKNDKHEEWQEAE